MTSAPSMEMQWHPQLENGELLNSGEAAGFDVMVTSDQKVDAATPGSYDFIEMPVPPKGRKNDSGGTSARG